MKVCIYGAGAIGGYFGVQLHAAGVNTSLVAPGAHLEAMRRNGLTLHIGGESRVARLRCTDRADELGPQDYVIICLKAHSVPGAVEAMRPLIGPDTTIVTAVNGVPYWYFYRHGGELENCTLETIDPGGRQWAILGPERAVGCIVYPATEIVAPGIVKHVYGNKCPPGEPDGSVSERATRLSRAMEAAGLQAPVLDNIRNEIWLKLWGNLCLNPISALTNATLDVITADLDVRDVARRMMLEAKAIGDRLGVTFRVDVERRPRRRGRGRRPSHVDAAGSRPRPADGDRRDRRRRPGAWSLGRRADADDRCGARPRPAAGGDGRSLHALISNRRSYAGAPETHARIGHGLAGRAEP
jgi:2-dehydropantoate 2-reductase